MQQSSQGAELNSEATLNCNGNDFKCVNLTHYQPCSLTERKGHEPQWTINGVVLPCLIGQPCNDEKSDSCAVSRPVQSIERETPAQIPVKVTVVQEPAVNAVKASEALPTKIPSAEPNAASSTEQEKIVASSEHSITSSIESVSVSTTEKGKHPEFYEFQTQYSFKKGRKV